MSFKPKYEKVEETNYSYLKSAKLITEEDMEGDPAWNELGRDYAEAKEENSPWAIKAILTIVNSIIFQRRLVFIITRKSLRKLLRSDKNWGSNLGLKQGNYKYILKLIYSHVGELVEYGHSKQTGRNIAIIRVTSKDILKYLNVNYEEQLEEARGLLRVKRVKNIKNTADKIKKEDKENKIPSFLQELKQKHPQVNPYPLSILYVQTNHTEEYETIKKSEALLSNTEYSEENKDEWEKIYDQAKKASKAMSNLEKKSYKYFLQNPEKYLQLHEEYVKMNKKG